MILKISKHASINTDFFVSAYVSSKNTYSGEKLHVLMRDGGSIDIVLDAVLDSALTWLQLDRKI